MTRNYETRCWMCGKADLEPDDRGMKCRSCGATFNLLPKPGLPPFKGEGWKVTAGLTPQNPDHFSIPVQ